MNEMSASEIVFLHTSDAHIATFDALRARIAPEVKIRHILRADLLEQAVAAGGVSSAVEAAARDALAAAIGKETRVLVCTCSTLGQVAEQHDADAPVPVMRIDRPMADQAVLQAKNIAVCAALPTALSATAALVRTSAEYMQKPNVMVRDHLFSAAWKHFEQGNMEAYAAEIARGLRGAAFSADLILLAQASMEGAVALCQDIAIPIWSSPETGFRAALALMED